MRVRLTKKLANVVNGIDLSPYNEGDIIDLPVDQARVLIGEGWAEEIGRARAQHGKHGWLPAAVALPRTARNPTS